MNPTVKKVVIGIATAVGIIGGFVAINSYYVTYAYHDLCDLRYDDKLAMLQDEIQIQRAMDEVTFWIKIEMELYKALRDHPYDKGLEKKYLDAIKKREKAEERLRDIQDK